MQAFGGLTSERLLKKLQNRVFSVVGYSNVVIHVGTNDIWSISDSQFRDNIRNVVAEIRKSNSHCNIFLSSILPRLVDFKDTEIEVYDFNSMLQEIALVNEKLNLWLVINHFIPGKDFPSNVSFRVTNYICLRLD